MLARSKILVRDEMFHRRAEYNIIIIIIIKSLDIICSNILLTRDVRETGQWFVAMLPWPFL